VGKSLTRVRDAHATSPWKGEVLELGPRRGAAAGAEYLVGSV
jgi:hypothetical protein